MKVVNYRGVSKAFVVNVLEGNGNEEAPYSVSMYVIMEGVDGVMRTVGKIVELTEVESNYICDSLTNGK